MKKPFLKFIIISFIVFSFTQCKKDDGPSNVCNISASFTKSISSGTVYFTNTSTNFSTGDSIKWTFGDGASSYDSNPIHTYSASGRYSVCLWVKHISNNCVSSVCDSISINTSNTNSGYTGTGSVTQGIAATTTNNLFPQGIRVAAIGTINSSDNQNWSVPADVNYNNTTFPFAPDLYNSYIAGHSYANASSAIAALNGNDIVTIDNNGDVYTAYIFADNYFEMYVNGQPVGKDAVPYTEFNSSIVRFK
jgi:PKD repeat protein